VTDMAETADAADPQAYVARVMAEIEEEVRLRRSSGDLPPKLERELDELFLAHSPVAGRGGDLTESLRMVDAAIFVDPVVPVASERAAGAVVKKGMRSLLLWYVGWITHQVSQFASAVSRSLHIVEGRLKELERKVEVQRVPSAGVVELPALHRSTAWWVQPALDALVKSVEDSDLDVCKQAIQALAGFSQDDHEASDSIARRTFDPLTRGLKHQNVNVRRAASRAFAKTGPRAGRDEDAISALAIALNDPDSKVREFAAIALGAFESRALRAVPALLKACEDPVEDVRRMARNALNVIAK